MEIAAASEVMSAHSPILSPVMALLAWRFIAKGNTTALLNYASQHSPRGHQAFAVHVMHQPLLATSLPPSTGQGAHASDGLPWKNWQLWQN
jgi:hypothetical protein